MARDNRIIYSAVRLDVPVNINEGRFFPDGKTPMPEVLQTQSTVFADGQEDELQQALSPAQGARLLEAGALAGDDWKFTGTEAEPPTEQAQPAQDATPEEQAEQAATFISGAFSVARSSDESALDFLERVVVKDSDKGDDEGDEPEALDAATETLLRTRFDTPEDVQAAEDSDILAINGIGPKSLAKIRQVYPQNG